MVTTNFPCSKVGCGWSYGIGMFCPKACSPNGDSPGTTDDSPDDI